MKTYNICFIGDSHTGKSHLIHTYINKHSVPYVNQLTIGIEFNKKEDYDKILYIWDYSQSKTIDKYISAYLQMIDLFFIVVDINNWENIQNIDYYKNIIKNRDYYILVNKSDKIVNSVYKTKILDYLDKHFKNRYVFTTSYDKDRLDCTINNIIDSLFNN